MRIRWIRVVLGAILLELVLLVTLVPVSFVDMTAFFIAVPIGCFAFGYLVTWWLLRKMSTDLLLHGALVGVVATAMYFALASSQPDGIKATIAVYGPTLFWTVNALRVAGCVAGAAHRQRQVRRGASVAAHV